MHMAGLELVFWIGEGDRVEIKKEKKGIFSI
jgi:hypothetical protein